MKKRILIFLVTMLFIAFGKYWDAVDSKCREFMGWELYTIYPEPICHVEKNFSPLRELRHKPTEEMKSRFDI